MDIKCNAIYSRKKKKNFRMSSAIACDWCLKDWFILKVIFSVLIKINQFKNKKNVSEII